MSSRLRATAAALLATGVTGPAVLQAQAAAPTSTAAVLPFAQAAKAAKPGTWKWSMKRVANGESQDVGTRVLTLQRSTGSGSWLLLDAQTSPTTTVSDSLVLGASDFGAERRAMTVETPMGSVTLALKFTSDSVTGAMAAQGQSQSIAMKNVPGSISTDGVLFLTLASLPLADGWTGRADMLNPVAGGSVPLTFAVKGSERVTVPAGSFDTWVVQTTSGPGSTTLYVAKGGPVVRVVSTHPQMAGASVESVLTK